MSDKYINPDYLRIVSEFMDYTDRETCTTLMSIDEADQNKVLMSLTNRLYDIITDKANEIDFGNIPKTKGDVEALPQYQTLQDSINVLRGICMEYKQPTAQNVDIASEALTHMLNRKDLFERCFKMNIDLGILTYNTVYLAIIQSISLLIAACIEYIKSPAQESYQIALDTAALAKTSDNMLFESLTKFNRSCRNKELDRALDFVIKSHTKNFIGGMDAMLMIGVGGVLMTTLIFNIIPIIRELIFFVYHTRVTISDYFDMQADLLVMNADSLDDRLAGRPASERKEIKNKQLKIARSFRTVSNAIAIDCKNADVKATKEIANQDKAKMKIKDVKVDLDSARAAEVDDASDSRSTGSSVLF